MTSKLDMFKCEYRGTRIKWDGEFGYVIFGLPDWLRFSCATLSRCVSFIDGALDA